jgi:hypothetical protein
MGNTDGIVKAFTKLTLIGNNGMRILGIDWKRDNRMGCARNRGGTLVGMALKASTRERFGDC